MDGLACVHGRWAFLFELSQGLKVWSRDNRMFSTTNPQLWVGDEEIDWGTAGIELLWDKDGTYAQVYTQSGSTAVEHLWVLWSGVSIVNCGE